MTGTRRAGLRRGPAFTLAFALALSFALDPSRVPGSLAFGAPPATPGPRVEWHVAPARDSAPTSTFVEVAPLPRELRRRLDSPSMTPEERKKLFSVIAGHGDPIEELSLPPMAGRYEVACDALRFFPAFPLQPGVRYRAVFRAPPAPALAAVHEIPVSHPAPTTVVTAIHPTTDILPENLLKFYLHFSAPMTRGHIYEHIHLRDAVTGRDVELPFLEIDEELWDPELRRVTLLLDPGRIKRGVKPLEDIGSSLEPGKSYTLTLDSAWLDATGTPLESGSTKSFRVLPPDREPPDPARWKITPPRSPTREPLALEFDEPLDHAIVLRTFQVVDPAGKTVAGRGELGVAERSWKFTPDEPWKPGPHEIRFPSTIEDLAGNNVGKPFDVDLFEKVERKPTRQIIALPFPIR